MKIGILGCANFAVRRVIPTLRALPEYKVVAVASRSDEKARRVGEQFDCEGIPGYEQLLQRKDIEAIYIPLPTGMHHEWVKKALQCDKHVLVEKSAGCTLEEVTDMVDLAKERRLCLQENFQFQFHSQHAFVKKLVENGDIGEIRCFRSSFGFPPFEDATNIRYQKALGGGALLDAGAYVLKATQFMLGSGFGVKAATLTYDATRGVDTCGGAFLVNADGLCSEVAFGFDHFYQCNYEIWGSRGKVTSERAFTAHAEIVPTVRLETDKGTRSYELPCDDQTAKLFGEFAETIREKRFSQYGEEMLLQAELIQQVVEKAREN